MFWCIGVNVGEGGERISKRLPVVISLPPVSTLLSTLTRRLSGQMHAQFQALRTIKTCLVGRRTIAIALLLVLNGLISAT